jgi:hypothetical protein
MPKIIGTSYLLVLFTVCPLNLDCFSLFLAVLLEHFQRIRFREFFSCLNVINGYKKN